LEELCTHSCDPCPPLSRGSATPLNVAMADEGYSTAWESTDNSDPNTNQTLVYGLFQPNNPSLIHESATAPALSQLPVKSTSPPPPPRSSSDSLGRSSTSRWRDSVPVAIERKDTLSTIPSDAISLVEPSFDENVLRVLCELDVSIFDRCLLPVNVFASLQCGVPLLLDRIKQSMVSCRVSIPFKLSIR
jgi:hypothetical protein